jgi:hypothetical protein
MTAAWPIAPDKELDHAALLRHRSRVEVATHVPHQQRYVEMLQRKLGLYPALSPFRTPPPRAERVQAHLAPTGAERVQRYELPGLGALNFVLDRDDV